MLCDARILSLLFFSLGVSRVREWFRSQRVNVYGGLIVPKQSMFGGKGVRGRRTARGNQLHLHDDTASAGLLWCVWVFAFVDLDYYIHQYKALATSFNFFG